MMKDFCKIRKHLSLNTAKCVANAFVGSKLDFCNSLYNGISQNNLSKLQRIQNTLCRIVARVPRRDHITPHLFKLHWLPIRERILFKTCVIIYKTLDSNQPLYLKHHLVPWTPTHSYSTRSSKNIVLSPKLDCPYYDRNTYKSYFHLKNSFYFSAPRLWNDLPVNLRSAPSLSSFRRQLKTYLFLKAYPP